MAQPCLLKRFPNCEKSDFRIRFSALSIPLFCISEDGRRSERYFDESFRRLKFDFRKYGIGSQSLVYFVCKLIVPHVNDDPSVVNIGQLLIYTSY